MDSKYFSKSGSTLSILNDQGLITHSISGTEKSFILFIRGTTKDKWSKSIKDAEVFYNELKDLHNQEDLNSFRNLIETVFNTYE